MAPAVPVQKNWRRDIAEGGEQEVQRQDAKPRAEPALLKSVMESSRLGCSRPVMLFGFGGAFQSVPDEPANRLVSFLPERVLMTRAERRTLIAMFSSAWDERFMLLAHQIARWSKEKGRRVGAVIVGPDKEIRSTGFNGLPRGVRDDVEARHCRETGAKYLWSSHAERNAIYNAARIGVSLKGCIMYVPWFPCVECAKAIIQSGISELVAYEPDFSEPKWGVEFQVVQEMFGEADLRVRYIPKLEELSVGS
jgi:dCMP deaminase